MDDQQITKLRDSYRTGKTYAGLTETSRMSIISLAVAAELKRRIEAAYVDGVRDGARAASNLI